MERVKVKQLIEEGERNLPAVANVVDLHCTAPLARLCGWERVAYSGPGEVLRWLDAIDAEIGDRLGVECFGQDWLAAMNIIRACNELYHSNIDGLDLARKQLLTLTDDDKLACVRTIVARPVGADAAGFLPTLHLREPFVECGHARVILAALRAMGDARAGDVSAVEYRDRWRPCLALATDRSVPWVFRGDGDDGDPEAALTRWYVRACFEVAKTRAERWAAEPNTPREALHAVGHWLDDPTPGRRLVALGALQATADAATPVETATAATDMPNEQREDETAGETQPAEQGPDRAVKAGKQYHRAADDLADLEKTAPLFNADGGRWVRNKVAAKLEGIATRSLARYRGKGLTADDGSLGRDPDGRIWRRPGTPSSHPWYLRSTLKSVGKGPQHAKSKP